MRSSCFPPIFRCLLGLLFSCQLTAFSKAWEIEGQLRLSEEWLVPAPTTGILEQLAMTEGTSVVVGQTLAVWDRSLTQAEMAAAASAYRAAILAKESTVDLEFALSTAKVRRAELQRSQMASELYAKAISQVELERLALMVEQADFSAQQARHQQRVLEETVEEKRAILEVATRKWERGQLHSRVQGIVVEILTKAGQWTSEGTPIARIIRLDKLRFESLVDWKLAAQLKPQQKIDFIAKDTASTIPSPYSGIVVFASPEVNPVTEQVRIIAEVDNAALELKPGLQGLIKPVE
jgi:multidrug efflux pump subunit AcrA (membrane-fusion protein)